MWTLLLVMVTTGSPALFQAAPVQGHGGRCSFAGVLHVEGTSNYSLTFQQASELCQSLGYKLATQEQVTQAYEKGLRTCRYGWIDGQNVMFLPHITSPNCDSGFTEVTLQSKAAEYLSGVYCFNPSDSSDPSCEEAVKSDPQTPTSKNTSAATEKPDEDVLEEALIEGFLVHVRKTKRSVHTETSSLNAKMNPNPAAPNTNQTATSLQSESVASATVDTEDPADEFGFGRIFSSAAPSVLFPEAEGSGSGSETGLPFENHEPIEFPTRSMTTEAKENTPTPNDYEVPEVTQKKAPKQEISREGRKGPLIPSSQKGEGTPAWLVIFVSCVVVGAILCIFAAIATKDKWYGPRRSKNIKSEDYSKAATLPLSEKEQEIVTLMSVANPKSDKMEDVKVTCLDKHEREYLM